MFFAMGHGGAHVETSPKCTIGLKPFVADAQRSLVPRIHGNVAAWGHGYDTLEGGVAVLVNDQGIGGMIDAGIASGLGMSITAVAHFEEGVRVHQFERTSSAHIVSAHDKGSHCSRRGAQS